MKTKKVILALFTIMISVSLFAQTTDEIVKSHIDAIGGKANWDKLKSFRMENTLKQQGAEMKITITQVDRKQMRQDISVMGMTGYSIVNNKEGWSYMPWQGQTKPEAMTEDDVKNAQDDLYIQDDFITYKELDKKLEYFGKDDVDGTECLKMKMTDKNGQESTYYIDPSNYYIIKQTQKIKANGKEMESSTFFSDYKKLDIGIMFPMSMRSDWGELQVTKLDINPTIDDSIFSPAK